MNDAYTVMILKSSLPLERIVLVTGNVATLNRFGQLILGECTWPPAATRASSYILPNTKC